MVELPVDAGTMTALGTGGWIPTELRQTSSYLYRLGNRALVLDAGSGFGNVTTRPHLLRGVTDVTIVLSHFHLDHVEGLGMINALDIEVTVGGPGKVLYDESTRTLLSRLLGQPFKTSNPLRDANFVDLEDGENELNGWRLNCRRQLRHPLPSMAFRVGDTFAYLTDTEFDEGSITFAGGVAWLMHEAWGVGAATEGGHTSGFDAGRIAAAAKVGGLYLTHLNPSVDDNDVLGDALRSFDKSHLAHDGQVLFGARP